MASIDTGKLTRLRRRADESKGATRTATDRAYQARLQRQDLEAEQLRQSQQGRVDGAYRHAADGTMVNTLIRAGVSKDLLVELERAKAVERETAAYRDRVNAEVHDQLSLVNKLEVFAEGQGLNLEHLPAPTTPIRHFEQLPTRDEIDTLRVAIVELRQTLKALSRQPVSEAEAYGRIDKYLAALAARAVDRLDLSPLINPSGDLARFRLFDHENIAGAAQGARIEACLVAAAVPAWQALLREVATATAVTRGGWGLDKAAREARTRELAAQLLAAEIAEERLIETCESFGVSIARRADADPAAVLWLAAEAA